jgi:hypothetical protein
VNRPSYGDRVADLREDGGEPTTLGEYVGGLRFRGWSVRTWGIAAGALALAASGMFGGLDEATERVAEVPPGTAIAGGQFTVVVERATAVRTLEPTYTPSNPDGALLAVITEVTLTDPEGRAVDPGALRLVGVPGIDADAQPLGTFSMREDNTAQPTLQPEVPERVAYLWDLPHAADLPATVTVEVQKRRHTDADALTGRANWFPDGPAGSVVLTVQNKVEQVSGR